jgi:hypothetical protein
LDGCAFLVFVVYTLHAHCTSPSPQHIHALCALCLCHLLVVVVVVVHLLCLDRDVKVCQKAQKFRTGGRFLIRLSDPLFLAPQSDLEKSKTPLERAPRETPKKGVERPSLFDPTWQGTSGCAFCLASALPFWAHHLMCNTQGLCC